MDLAKQRFSRVKPESAPQAQGPTLKHRAERAKDAKAPWPSAWLARLGLALLARRLQPRAFAAVSKGRGSCLILLVISSLWLEGCAGSPSTLDPQSPTADQLAFLWWVMFSVAVVVCLVIAALVVIVVLRARHSPTTEVMRDPPDGRKFILVGGILVPIVILIALLGLLVYTSQSLAAPSSTQYTVEVIGHQWWWEIRYPDQAVLTANEIHIPTGQPVRVKVTSGDVIHSFWVPQLHGKIDLIPGQVNTIELQADRPGIYRGQCAEFCGTAHAQMAFLVIAQPPAEFAAWLEQQAQPAPQPDDPLVRQGQQVFLGSACVYCHTVRGTNASGRLGPDLTHLASRETLGAGILDNNEGNLAGWIIDPQHLKPGNRMPVMNLDSDAVQALLAYLKTLE